MEEDTKNRIEQIRANQATTDILLQMGSILLAQAGMTSESKWTIESVYQNDDCSFGFVHCTNIGIGDYPDHVHCSSIEYLICVTGSVMFYLDGQAMRVLKAGDCASVPSGHTHRSKPLENGTKLFYICVPADKTIPKGCEM